MFLEVEVAFHAHLSAGEMLPKQKVASCVSVCHCTVVGITVADICAFGSCTVT